MSASRDKLNRGALSLLGGRPPSERPQPLMAAAMSGPGGGSSVPWPVLVSVDGVTLMPGKAYHLSGSGWADLTTSINICALAGICIASGSDPASSTILVAGVCERAGTAGALLYADVSGSVTETFPGDADDTADTAPWVWRIGFQMTSGQAVIVPTTPFRPRRVKYCLEDGATQVVYVMREEPDEAGGA